MLQHLAQCPREYFHSSFVRLAKDVFQVESTNRWHTCIVTEPYICTLEALRQFTKEYMPNGALTVELAKTYVCRLLGAARWLQRGCDIVHAGKSLPAASSLRDTHYWQKSRLTTFYSGALMTYGSAR